MGWVEEAGVKPAEVTVQIWAELRSGVWDVDVCVNGDHVGGGTSPHGPLDVADDILYGGKNDWLNGSRGVLGDLLDGKWTA